MDNSTVWKIIDKYFEDNPQCLVRHHIESYNDFFKNGIFQIFKEKNPLTIQTQFDEEIDDYRNQCIMYFGGKNGDKIYFGKPVIYDDERSHYMFPNEARLRNMTYGMTVHYDIEIEFIKNLRPGEKPGIPGFETIEGGFTEAQPFENFKNKTTADLNREAEEAKELNKKGGKGEKIEESSSNDQEGGAPKGPPKRRKQRKLDTELTAAETALFREAIDKSMVAPNVQKETVILEKILLGKFPIMVQSHFCVLNGLPREIRHTMGECSNDVGGYFIIDGKEKTVITQEKFGYNMLNIREINDDKLLYAADITSVSENVSKPIRSLSVRIMAPTPSYTYKNIVVKIPNVRAPVPLFILFRALGVISDKQIITMCLLDLEKYESLIDYFEPSVHDAGGIMTQRSALKYIANLTKVKTTDNVLEILADYFLPHVGELNFTQKAYFLGYMVKELISVYAGIQPPTDRDNFKFKRLELVGSLLNDLFREYYTIQMRQLHLAFEEKITYNRGIYEDNLKGLVYENYKEVFRERSLEAGFKKAFKGNWGAQPHTKRVGVVQDLNRLSFNSMMSHLRKTNLPLDSSVKLVGPRVLHNTQWGFFDPIDTPDGANIGIHKHLSISAHITQGYSREPMISWLREKIDMRLIEDCSPIILSKMTKVFVNGLWAGAIDNPTQTVEKIRLFRRNGLIPTYTSVNFDIGRNTVFIYTDAGRICRPVFYRDGETGKFSFESENIRKKIEDGEFSWKELISGFNKKKIQPTSNRIYELHQVYEGIDSETNPAKLKRFLEEKAILDYIDTNESEGALIAFSKDLPNNNSKEGEGKGEPTVLPTHMEIHESLIFGMMSNLINFPENNPATRNSFSCGQSKQACSLYHTNHQLRMDKTAVVLVNGQVPLVKTRYLEHINREENPYGENAIVAIMCYTGYNVEDAVLINEGALKRGLFRTTYYTTYEAHEEKSKVGGATVDKVFTNIESESNVIGTKPGYDYSKLDKYGLIRENTPVDDKTVLIGLTTSGSDNKDVRLDGSKVPKKGQLGVVDKTFITDGEEGFRIAKIRIREVRIPNLGDKMASRAGQKGTVGLVISEADMPFTKDGLRPDIIINPHAIPTRMTIGQLVETITGKACLHYGGFGDCTAFNNDGSKIKVFGEMLTRGGFHSSGNDILYNGMTGEQIETEIFMGPTYYMRLKHMVKDKINYRAMGPRTALTRQPVSGRANDGGLRIGEMERDSVISHGASVFLRESMMERGDKYYMAVCNTTGMVAIYNPSKNLFMSPSADGPIKFTGSIDNQNMRVENVTKYGRDFSVICVPYSLKLLIQELQTINVQMRLITEDNIEQLENMSYSNNIEKITFSDKFDAKSYINDINKELNRQLNKPVAPQVSPNMPESPEYIQEGSPSIVFPQTPAETSSPIVFPETPSENPPAEGILSSIASFFSPKSPETSPPEPFAELSEKAQQYTIGNRVFLREDPNNTRIWTVKNVGDRMITIETLDLQGLASGDNIKVVTADDIIPYNPALIANPTVTPAPQVGGTMFEPPMNSPMVYGGAMPAINFAPQFKIMNGGNDFSTEPVAPVPSEEPLQTGGGEPIRESIPTTALVPSEEPPSLDFSKLLIQKLG
jgi:DNA-directed RNA polymerase II subunit RPB2